MNMDLELKFLPRMSYLYEIDDWFFQQLSDYSLTDASLIVAQTLAVLSELPTVKMVGVKK